eukprot:TRINITY_DN65419_c0_g1_i1.p2 TRINITY_DN65419_c0_g1~~TRINITY_DN65419_c0_g1_i1.p2  ORF type:complete len:125 (-),score=11.86 TRINITY_DN65419_c0_g1_i1:132-506(-)
MIAAGSNVLCVVYTPREELQTVSAKLEKRLRQLLDELVHNVQQVEKPVMKYNRRFRLYYGLKQQLKAVSLRSAQPLQRQRTFSRLARTSRIESRLDFLHLCQPSVYHFLIHPPIEVKTLSPKEF